MDARSSPPEGGALTLLQGAGRLLLRMSRRAALLPLALWGGLIVALSSIHGEGLPSDGMSTFKGNLAHAFVFGLFALWAALTLPRERGWPRIDARSAAFVLALVLAFGTFDEWYQSFTPGRDSSVYDVLTDVVGGAATLWIASYVARPGANEEGLWLRLAAAVAASVLSALLATYPPAGT